MPGDVDLDDLPYEDILSDDEELEMKKEKEKTKRRELLAKVDFSRYTAVKLLISHSVKQQMSEKMMDSTVLYIYYFSIGVVLCA